MNNLTTENNAETIILWRCCSIYIRNGFKHMSPTYILAIRNEIFEVNWVKL
jgi:hypothetical protein